MSTRDICMQVLKGAYKGEMIRKYIMSLEDKINELEVDKKSMQFEMDNYQAINYLVPGEDLYHKQQEVDVLKETLDLMCRDLLLCQRQHNIRLQLDDKEVSNTVKSYIQEGYQKKNGYPCSPANCESYDNCWKEKCVHYRGMNHD